MGEAPRAWTHRRVIAHHLILTLYGHWPPNDLRGSYSHAVRKPALRELGAAHFGRRGDREQPSRRELRGFHREVEVRLDFPVVWFDDASRQACGRWIGEVVRGRGYTCWACAICRNHVHLCVRVHRDRDRVMWGAIADASRQALREAWGLEGTHPVWAAWPFAKFKRTPGEVRNCVAYVARNPEKEGLSPQAWHFVEAYDGWPYRKSAG